MSLKAFLISCLSLIAAPALADTAPVSVPSSHTLETTVERLVSAIESRNLTLFHIIDHQAAAESVELEMPGAQVVFFGAPASGTPVFLAAPTAAIDLPLRVLVYENSEGEVFLAYNSADWMSEAIFDRHGLSMPENARGMMGGLLEALAEEATGS